MTNNPNRFGPLVFVAIAALALIISAIFSMVITVHFVAVFILASLIDIWLERTGFKPSFPISFLSALLLVAIVRWALVDVSVMRTGSMEPLIPMHSLVYTIKPIADSHIAVKDIVLYKDMNTGRNMLAIVDSIGGSVSVTRLQPRITTAVATDCIRGKAIYISREYRVLTPVWPVLLGILSLLSILFLPRSIKSKRRSDPTLST